MACVGEWFVHTEWLGEGYAEWKGMFGGGEKLVDGNG
jgi:hypothetical protein